MALLPGRDTLHRRYELKRTSLTRRTPLKSRSERRSTLYKNERVPLVREMLKERPFCEAERAGAPGKCFGGLSLHEILPRGRGGSITDRDNIKVVCISHNERISNDVDVMRWAYDTGFLRRA